MEMIAAAVECVEEGFELHNLSKHVTYSFVDWGQQILSQGHGTMLNCICKQWVLNEKSDVYSYGILHLEEAITGRNPVNYRRLSLESILVKREAVELRCIKRERRALQFKCCSNRTYAHEYLNLSFSGFPRVPEFTGKDEMKEEKEALKGSAESSHWVQVSSLGKDEMKEDKEALKGSAESSHWVQVGFGWNGALALKRKKDVDKAQGNLEADIEPKVCICIRTEPSANPGSVLSGGGSKPFEKATSADWADMVDGLQKGALESRLGIPMFYGSDAVHGNNNVYGTTIFPHNVGLGATRLVFNCTKSVILICTLENVDVGKCGCICMICVYIH
ncbi:lysosomal beta glucosidase-like protein [Tanacetum coccineum]